MTLKTSVSSGSAGFDTMVVFDKSVTVSEASMHVSDILTIPDTVTDLTLKRVSTDSNDSGSTYYSYYKVSGGNIAISMPTTYNFSFADIDYSSFPIEVDELSEITGFIGDLKYSLTDTSGNELTSLTLNASGIIYVLYTCTVNLNDSNTAIAYANSCTYNDSTAVLGFRKSVATVKTTTITTLDTFSPTYTISGNKIYMKSPCSESGVDITMNNAISLNTSVVTGGTYDFRVTASNTTTPSVSLASTTGDVSINSDTLVFSVDSFILHISGTAVGYA